MTLNLETKSGQESAFLTTQFTTSAPLLKLNPRAELPLTHPRIRKLQSRYPSCVGTIYF